MLHTIKKVEYIDHYKLKLVFSNRQTKIVDLESVLKKAKNMLVPLKDIDYFKQVETDGITLCWPNGVDFCPDVLYEMGKNVKLAKSTAKSVSHKNKNKIPCASEKSLAPLAAKSKH